jgi:hypothetical protein
VFGGSPSEALQKVESVLAQIEANPWSLLLEWKPAGASEPSLFEVRETGNWTPEYDERAFTGAGLFVFQVQIPVAPLVQGLPVSVYKGTGLTLPAVLELNSIPGDAPAKAEVGIEPQATTDPASAVAAWALIGWCSRPTTPIPKTVRQEEEAKEAAWSHPPFGLLEATGAEYQEEWVEKLSGEARGGKLLAATAASGKLYQAGWRINPATMVPDSFSGELAVEVWGRVMLAPTLKTPTLVVSARSESESNYAASRYTDEFGSAGRTLTVPSTKTCFRMTRLGTLHLLIEPLRVQPWWLWVTGSVGAGSSGEWGINYLMLCPVMQRACSPTSKELAGPSYPKFSTRPYCLKTIRSDLSGWANFYGGSGGFPDTGLGGSLLELPPGNTNLLVKLSNLVPDDPTITGTPATTSDALAFTSAKVEVTVTPRWFLNPS